MLFFAVKSMLLNTKLGQVFNIYILFLFLSVKWYTTRILLYSFFYQEEIMPLNFFLCIVISRKILTCKFFVILSWMLYKVQRFCYLAHPNWHTMFIYIGMQRESEVRFVIIILFLKIQFSWLYCDFRNINQIFWLTLFVVCIFCFLVAVLTSLSLCTVDLHLLFPRKEFREKTKAGILYIYVFRFKFP